MTFASVKAAVARYTGYARFMRPLWASYVSYVSSHPKLAAALILVLALLAVR